MNIDSTSKKIKWETLGFIPLNASWGVELSILFVGQWFDKLIVQSTTYVQNSLGIIFIFNMLQAILRIVMFFLSTTSFIEAILKLSKHDESHVIHKTY